jgi:hypothetical protein
MRRGGPAPRLFFRMDAQLQIPGWTAAIWLAGIVAILLVRRADHGRWLTRLDASSLGATLREVVVFLYCVAAPALLLIAGIISRDDLGVPAWQTLTDWLREAGVAASAAAAAVVTGVIAILGFLYLSNDNSGSTTGTSMARYQKSMLKEIKKTSDTELNEFVKQFDEAGLTTEETATTDTNKEVKELLKDIPETELKQFLDETAETETSTDETLLMN